MNFSPPLIAGRLVKRYKRFLADVVMPGGEVRTVHCPNTGAMTGCSRPGSDVWLSDSGDTRRKYRYTLEIVQAGESLVCVNTGRANRLVEEALHAGAIPSLAGYGDLRREPPIPGGGGRFDFLLSDSIKGNCYVEVKSMTLGLEDGYGAFPDAVSVRALKHVSELIRCREQKRGRAVLFFCAMHTGVRKATTADDIHPAYGELVRQALAVGVEVIAWACAISPTGMGLNAELPFVSPK